MTEFEQVVCTMIESYDRYSRQSSFEYRKYPITISFKPHDFTRVLDISGQGGCKVVMKNHKLLQDRKEHWIKLVGRDLTPEEFNSVLKGTRSHGMRQDFIREGP